MQQIIRYTWTHSSVSEELAVAGVAGCCPSIDLTHHVPTRGGNKAAYDISLPPQAARELMLALRAQLDAMEEGVDQCSVGN